MSRDTLTGSRIRERRVMLGLKQAELARRADVSASYLNLIEHNRRRIGGKLLLDIAAILDVEPTVLTEGAEATLLAGLREVSAAHPDVDVELDRVEEFAGRFSGWARLITALAGRESSLEQTVVALTDRMTHDPQLAEALHDMLEAVTAIRSTSSILVETDEIEPEWRDRFLRNVNEDAQRLTEGSQALVSYLNAEMGKQGTVTTPQDEIEAYFSEKGFHFAELEQCAEQGAEVEAALDALLSQAAGVLVSVSAREQVRAQLRRYYLDAAELPNDRLLDLVSVHGLAVDRIAAAALVDVALVMRRLASIPGHLLAPLLEAERFDIDQAGVGLAVCDSSGTLTMRKPLAGFALPRFGAACPLWTLYQALSRPMIALQETARQAGRDGGLFETYAIAMPVSAPRFGAVPLLQAHMLIVPIRRTEKDTDHASERPIGVSCRICPRQDCPGRREPSILARGL